MPDELSVRGLINSEFDMPVRSFSGVFDGYSTKPAEGYSGTRVELRFKDVEDIVAVSPYNLPIIVLNLGLSNKNKSKWGYLANSIATLIDPEQDIKDTIGLRMRVVYCDGQNERPEPKPIWSRDADRTEFPDGMLPTPVWVVTEIEGMGGDTEADSGLENYVLAALDGKTLAQFNKWAFSDARVRANENIRTTITDKSFVTAMKQLKKVIVDQAGVFHLARKIMQPEDNELPF